MLLLIPGPVSTRPDVRQAPIRDIVPWDNDFRPCPVRFSNFSTAPLPAFHAGCIGAIGPGDMAGAVRAIDGALRNIGVQNRKSVVA